MTFIFVLINCLLLLILFASFQGYTIVKKRTKTSTKIVLQKMMFLFNSRKELIDIYGNKLNTISQNKIVFWMELLF